MFYSHTILARKGPLGTVWIAAHLERKIKKPQIDGIDIPSYAEHIMFPEVPIALRLSGHLLLGLVRIYSWKVNYLFQDCNRMLTTIRTAFASVQVDLPVDADRALFEAITLPDTFNLDNLNLDDAIHQMETPDNHQKSPDQITLAEGEYVMIDLGEDATVEPFAPGRSSCFEPEPETSPPFDIDIGASSNPNDEIPVGPSQGSVAPNLSNINQTNEEPGPPEQIRKASQDDLVNFNDIDDNDPMDTVPDCSPFMTKGITPLAVDQPLSPAPGSLPGPSFGAVPRSTPHDISGEEPGQIGIPLPEYILKPSPPKVQDNKRKGRPEVQENKRKKRPKFDNEIGFSNVYMKKQYEGDELCKLVCKRRKLPHTAVDVWKFNRTSQKDGFLLEPLVHGMCTNLRETYERNFPCAESVSEDRATGVANVNILEAPPESPLTPKSPGNADAPRDIPLTLKSPGNADALPDIPLTQSPGYDTPELPRFSPRNTSPTRGDDTPFKTPGGTLRSELGGTGATEIPPTYGIYVSPGQKTRESEPNASPFPFIDELDEDLPEIPGLVSTPGRISSAGTGATGLGSMSARTRAVAQYFKDHMSSTTPHNQPGKFSLNRLLEGRARKQAARMFSETLVLKSYDYIDVQQEEAYGDIAISVKPSLAAAKL